MKMKERLARAGFLCVVVVFLCASQIVWGQQSAIEIDNVPRTAGIAIGLAPDYVGSEDYEFVAAPYFRYNFSDSERYLRLRATELDFNIVNHPWLRFGPVLNFRPGRSDVENDQVDLMNNIDSTFEGGAFVGAEFIDRANPRMRLLLSLQYLHDLGGEHHGSLTTGSVRGWLPLSTKFDATLGLSTSYGSSDYMETYFGVDPADSLRSGLRPFSADSGFRDVSVAPGVVMHLSQSWSLAAGLRYSRLLEDAEDSPVVDDVGSRHQWTGGIGLAYSW